MPYKCGDRVTIQSAEWIEKAEKDYDGDIHIPGAGFMVRSMFQYAGKNAVITGVSNPSERIGYYSINIDRGEWSWTEEMFMKHTEEKKKCYTEYLEL